MSALTREQFVKEIFELMEKCAQKELPNGTPRQKEKLKTLYMAGLAASCGSPYAGPLMEAAGFKKKKKAKKAKKAKKVRT
jgi:hypothetical protein